MTGPGLVVRLDDAAGDGDGADVDPRTDVDDSGRVTDRDLQTVVNEVWAAGAEAVAVNGQRLTALSAIRSAGDAILVDFRPLTPAVRRSWRVGDPTRCAASVRRRASAAATCRCCRDYGITLRA